MTRTYDFNSFESAGERLLAEGRVRDAMRIYFFMGDGDPSLDAGYLGMRLGECYDRLGEAPAAWYWFGRAIEENPGIYDEGGELSRRLHGPAPCFPEQGYLKDPVGERRRELAAQLSLDGILTPYEQEAGDIYAVAARLIAEGREQDALHVYLFAADGDKSLDKGELGRCIGELYDRLGLAYPAKYFYGRAVDENPERYEFSSTGDRLNALEAAVRVDDLFAPEDGSMYLEEDESDRVRTLLSRL